MLLGNPLTAQVVVQPTLNETSLINPTATNMQRILYPNPATDQLTITGLKEQTRYTISNMIGSILQEGNTLGKVNLSSLSSGSYSITLKAGSRIETKRFVKH